MRLLVALPLAAALPAPAQTTNQTEAATPAPLPIPAAPVIRLPETPVPSASPAPRPSPTRAPVATRPAPRSTPTPRVTARPTPSPTPTPTAASTPTPTPSPTPTPAPSPVPAPLASPSPTATATATPMNDLARTPDETPTVERQGYWAAIVLLVILLAGGGYIGWRWRETQRYRRREEELARRPQITVGGAVAPSVPPETQPTTAPNAEISTFWTPSKPVIAEPGAVASAPVEPEAPPPRPRLTMTLHPRRAGINLASATADLELTVRNEGDDDAEEVTVTLRLLAGRAKQDEELGELFGADQGKPVVPSFTLAPGEDRVCRTTLVLPRSEIEPIPVKNRPMFVPLVTADVRYLRPDGGRSQIASAYVIGSPRVDSEKLAPFWLDVGSKMREAVEARPYGLEIES